MVEPINLAEMNRQEKIANERGYGLHKIKDVNKAGFVQLITENCRILKKHNYLSSSEKAFLFDIQPLIEMHSNGLVNEKTGRSLTITEIAKDMNKSVRQIRSIVNQLIDKGIIFENPKPRELKTFGRVVSERALYLNPEIIFRGNRNKINATLSRMTYDNDPFEPKKIYLEWKVWMQHNAAHGKLYKRETYLKYKKTVSNG